MNCAECQRACLENGGRNQSPDCLEHLVGCAECRRVNERASVISKLLALKKYEHPDPLFEIRNAAAIRKRLSEEKPTVADWFAGTFRPWHGWAAGAVTACLAAAIVYFGDGAGSGGAAAPAVAAQDASPAQPAIAQPDPNDPAWNKPIFIVEESAPAPVLRPDETRFGSPTNASKPASYTIPEPVRAQE